LNTTIFELLLLSNRLMKKGGGLGPLKPWQPLRFLMKKVPNPIHEYGKDKFKLRFYLASKSQYFY